MLDCCLLAVKGFLKRTVANASSVPCTPQSWRRFKFGGVPEPPSEGLCPLLYKILREYPVACYGDESRAGVAGSVSRHCKANSSDEGARIRATDYATARTQ